MTSVRPRLHVDWRKLLARFLARWDELLLLTLMAAFLPYIALHLPDLAERRATRARAAELAAQAAREGLDYAAVLKDPSAAAGKVVFWRITHPGDLWLVDDDRGKPVVWEHAEPAIEPTGSNRGRGEEVAAVVMGVAPAGVRLSYRGSYSDSSGLRRKISRNATPEIFNVFSTALE